VFENRVLRRIFGPNRVEVVGGWKRLHDEELHNLYISPNIVRVFKSRRFINVPTVLLVSVIIYLFYRLTFISWSLWEHNQVNSKSERAVKIL